MTQITIDDATRERLRSARETVQLVAADGEVLGTFKPLDVPPYDTSLIPPISAEELHRRAAEPGGYTTDEVLRHLESRLF
jgi:hypothetical protein